MADFDKEGGSRRDYGHAGEKTAEGRVLRPRRPRIQGGGEKVEYRGGDYAHHTSGDDRRRSSFEHREGASRRPEGGHGRSEGGFRSEGYRRSSGSGYGRSEGGDRPQRRGFYGNDSEERGSYQRRGTPYRREGETGGRQEGGYRRSEGGYNRHEGGYKRPEGGFRGSRQDGRRSGGYQSRGRKGSGRPNPYSFSKRDEESIDRILSTKPQLESMNVSEVHQAPAEISSEMRLNKFIANSGVCSRREADTMIQAGVVTVNGEVVTELGTKVNIFEDEVKFNGERIRGEKKVYIVMNKPKGFVTTASDPHADKTVMDLLKDCPSRVFPVGRLDKNTTGVLMFTNDGEIAERLSHPSYDKKKIYQVIVDHEVKEEDFEKILSGVVLGDGEIAADELSYIDEHDHRKLGIEIHSGKNRIVRRIFESLGYEVRTLDRVYFAGLTKKNLKRGEWRYLSEKEASILKMGAYV